MSGLLQFIADQNSKSDLADWAKQQYGGSNPGLAQLAAADPDSFRQLLPTLIGQQTQQNAINQAFPQPSNQPTVVPQQVFPIGDGNNGDQQPGAPAPQSLPTQDYSPLASLMQPQVIPAAPPTALQRMMANYSQLPANLQAVAAQQQQYGGSEGGSSQIDTFANAVANYKMPLTNLSRNPAMQLAVKDRVLQINPDYDETIYKERQKVTNDFTPGGAVGKKLIAAETAINHLGMAQDASDTLGGVGLGKIGSGLINPLLNWANSQDPSLQKYQRFSKQGADEVAAFTDSNTIPGMAAQESLLSPDLGPDARKTAIQAAVATMQGKLQPEVDAYNRTHQSNKTVADFMAPETRQTLQKLGMLPVDIGGTSQSGSALSQMSQPSITPAMAQAELARRAQMRNR